MKPIAWVAIAAALSGCVPISSQEMQPQAQIYQQLTVAESLKKSIKLGEVQVGGAEGVLNSHSADPVRVAEYRDALKTALIGANLIAQDADRGQYVLDANLMSLESPFDWKFSVTVNSTAHYRLRHVGDNRIIWQETLMLPYEAKFSEAFDNAVRVRLAFSKAIRENITHLIRVLSAKTDMELAGNGV